MTFKNSRSALKLSLALLLAAAGGMTLGYLMSGDKDLMSGTALHSIVTTPQGPYMPKSESGAYLIAQRAEQDSDWPGTHRALKNLSQLTTMPPEQNARFFLSSIASGDWETAKRILADHPDDIKQSAPLVRMLYAMMAWSDGDDKSAIEAINSVAYNPISQPVLPFARGWMTREVPLLNIIQAAQDIGFSTLNMVRFFEATKQYDKADALMIKFQEADLSLRLRIWSVAYFQRRGLAKEAATAQAQLDAIKQNLPADTWQKEEQSVLAEAAGHLKSDKRALSLTLIDATEFLEANNASAIALLYMQAALKLTPDLYGANLLLANLYDSQGNKEEALEAFESVDKNDPSFVKAQLRMAVIYAEMEKSDKAAAIYSSLLSDHPKDPEIYFQQGEFYRLQKEYKKAITAYDKVETLLNGKIPDTFWTLYLARGLCYELMGDAKRAEKDYRLAFNLQPDNPEALNTLAYSWTEQGINLEQARGMLERALMANPNAAHITDSYGWVLFKLNRPADALPYLERAASMMPYDSTINDHLGDVYNALGRKREAEFMWKRALDNAEDAKIIEKIRAKIDRAP